MEEAEEQFVEGSGIFDHGEVTGVINGEPIRQRDIFGELTGEFDKTGMIIFTTDYESWRRYLPEIS